MKRYTYPKININKKDIEEVRINLYNGEQLLVGKNEIENISLDFYDRLIGTSKGFSPVGHEGGVKIKLNNRQPKFTYTYPYDKKEYAKGRKDYFINRCLDGQILSVVFYDETNGDKTVYGNIKATLDDGYLLITFIPNEIYGSYLGEEHYIYLPDHQLKNIRKIDLDFENCEYFSVYEDEILEFKLKFKKLLTDNSSALCREIETGYINIKLDGKRLMGFEDEVITKKQAEKRLTRKQWEIHDICHLCIYNEGYGELLNGETIEIFDIQSDEEIAEIERASLEDGHDYYVFYGGYAIREDDGSISLTFGDMAREEYNSDKQKLQ